MKINCRITQTNSALKLLLLALLVLLPGRAIIYADSSMPSQIHIKNISINVHNIYDMTRHKKLSFLYRWSNKLHAKTNDNVVRRELLFKEGDIYDPALVAESERILRSYAYFRKVTIHVSKPENNMVDMIVETHDVWTTELQANWGSTAGQTNWLLGVAEFNMLGQGQSIKASYKKNLDEKIQTFSFQEPRLLNTHINLETHLDKGGNSESWHFQANQPFYATVARWTAGFGIASQKEQQELLTSGVATSNFDMYHRSANVFTGYAFTAARDKRSALTLAGSIDYTDFSNITTSNEAAAPKDRALKGITLSYSFEKISFVKERQLTKFDRDEDLYLGPKHIISYGMFPEKFGSTYEEKIIEYYYSQGVPINPGEYALFNIYSKNQFREHMDTTSKQAIATQYYHRISKHHTLAANMEFIKLFNPDNDQELLLGDDNGLRGYTVREFSGNKKLFFSVEDRIFLMDDVWELFSVGGALFADSGMVWKRDESVDLSKLKSDIGIGLRFGMTRSSSAKVIRIDLAYALNRNEADKRWVITIKSGQIFEPKGIDEFRAGN